MMDNGGDAGAPGGAEGDLSEIARRMLDLWEQQLTAQMRDPENAAVMTRMFDMVGRTGMAMMAEWQNMSKAASSDAPDRHSRATAGGPEGGGSEEGGEGNGPTGAQAADASHERRVDELAELRERVAELERRLAALER